jgi:transposase
MWTPNPTMAVWLYRHPTDMRKSYDGLSALVKHAMDEQPLDGALAQQTN